MEQPELESLVGNLLQTQRDQTIGMYFMFWGLWNLVGVTLFEYAWHDALFWAVWIPLGAAIQTIMVTRTTRRLGRKLWSGTAVPHIWMVVFVSLLLLIWLFPFEFHLYSSDWIFPLTSIWVALGAFATGVHFHRPVIALASLAFWFAAPLYVIFPSAEPWIYAGSNVLGLILPGWVSNREERA